MAKTTSPTINAKEEIRMAKYIVEAPEPKKGQKASSGGIREKGRLATQFKNPVPYKEPAMPPAAATQNLNAMLVCKEQAKVRRKEAAMDLLGIAWQEFGEPLLRIGLHKLGDEIINKIKSPTKQAVQHTHLSEPEIIDVKADEVKTVYNDDKIIRFPNRKII